MCTFGVVDYSTSHGSEGDRGCEVNGKGRQGEESRERRKEWKKN
jgi:hypothetical protein